MNREIKQSLSKMISYSCEINGTFDVKHKVANWVIVGNNHKTTIHNNLDMVQGEDGVLFTMDLSANTVAQMIKELKAMAYTLEIDLENGLFKDFIEEGK